ncbi:ATP-binding protein [Halobacterium noricense]|uniref:ATP-binding protein n=1 Tax=Halobacterium noricense TaxID=223182 RepID=UPI001E3AE8F0|nr:ATP-binding protein [Halobacterium noricense]UHH24232.1 PAS domain-containing protein [Halobacterium noricense]
MPPADVSLVDRQPARNWLVAVLGAVLTVAAISHFETHGHNEPLVVAATVLPAVGVLGYGVWFWMRGPDVARGDAVFAWAVAGAGVVLALDLWAMFVGAYGTGAGIDHVFIQHTSVGALGAAIAGTYSERDRLRSHAHTRLKHALDAAMDGIAVLDPDRRVVYANAAFRDAYRTAGDEGVVGTHWTTYYPTDAEDRLAAVFEELDANGDSDDYWHGTVLAHRDDGRTYPQELSVTSLSGGGYVWVSRDVTAREERDQRLRVLNRVLRHNVRNSLNVVLGRAERLADRGDDGDVDSIVTAAEDLLDVSEKARVVERVLGGEDAGTVPLDSLLDTELQRARSQYPDAVFEVNNEVDADVDARLRLAVRELLTNAVEHNDADPPRVTVTASDDDLVEVRVSDNGPGIPEHERRALGGLTEESLQHGSGIGLWVVYWLARHSGAAVAVPDENTVSIRVPSGDN